MSIPVVGPVRNLMWRKDGRVLLIERDGPTIDVLDAKDWALLATIPGGLGPDNRGVSPAGRDSCIGYQSDDSECVFTVSSQGGITATQWPHQVAGETGVYVSPLRKFIRTQKRGANDFMEYFCRLTPDAKSDDVAPAWPSVPQGTKIQCIGWLLWEP